MAQATYQITLRVDGNHAVSVSGDDPVAIQDGLAWARGIYLKLQERAKQHAVAPVPRNTETVSHQITTPEQHAPTCAIHTTPMVSVSGKQGQFWSCHEKLQDQSWCPYKPPKEAGLSSR